MMKNKTYTTAEEITSEFIKSGWGEDTIFSELSFEEAKERGYCFVVDGMNRGRKYFKMGVCGNIYDDKGKLLMFGFGDK